MTKYLLVALVCLWSSIGAAQAQTQTQPAEPAPTPDPASSGGISWWQAGAIGAGAFDASNGPNCGDADVDGIPNLAERIRGYFERSSGGPNVGKKGI